jgi:hypothetical protein
MLELTDFSLRFRVQGLTMEQAAALEGRVRALLEADAATSVAEVETGFAKRGSVAVLARAAVEPFAG